MATLQEKLADSLAVLKAWQDDHKDNMVIQGASTLGEMHTKRLVNNGAFLPNYPFTFTAVKVSFPNN